MSIQTSLFAVPPTTKQTIIFPSIDLESKFRYRFYNPKLTNGKASKQEITEVLTDIEKITKPYSGKIRRASYYYFLAYVILSFIALLYFLITADDKSGVFNDALLAFFAGLGASILLLFLYLRIIEKKMIRKCHETIKKHNEKFVSKGLTWHLPADFPRWIELWKDYAKPQDVVNQTSDVSGLGQNFSDIKEEQPKKSNYVPPPQFEEEKVSSGLDIIIEVPDS